MQDIGAKARAAHPCVRDPHDVVHACLEELGGDRQMPPFGKSRPAQRAGVLKHHDGVLVHVEVVVDARPERFVAVEDQRLAAVPQQVRGGRCLFDHSPVRGEVAVENRGAALWVERLVQRLDQVAVADLHFLDLVGHGPPADGEGVAMQQGKQFLCHARQPARVEEVLHQKLS